MLFCIMWLVAIRLIKYFGKKKNELIDQRLNSASDTAIKISNLPNDQYSEHELIDYFDRLYEKIEENPTNMQSSQINNEEDNVQGNSSDDNKFNMKSIQIIYNMEFCRKMVEEIFQLSITVYGLLTEDEKGHRNVVTDYLRYRNCKNKLKQTYEFLQDLRKKFLNDGQFRKGLSSTCCLIEFYDQKDKNLMLRHFGKEKIGLIKEIQERAKKMFFPESKAIVFHGKVLRMERAPEPSDILW